MWTTQLCSSLRLLPVDDGTNGSRNRSIGAVRQCEMGVSRRKTGDSAVPHEWPRLLRRRATAIGASGVGVERYVRVREGVTRRRGGRAMMLQGETLMKRRSTRAHGMGDSERREMVTRRTRSSTCHFALSPTRWMSGEAVSGVVLSPMYLLRATTSSSSSGGYSQ